MAKAEEWVAPSKLTNLGTCHNPVISGDGTKIAFEFTTRTGYYEIYVINADGTGLTGPIATGRHPSISEDGSKIVFTRYPYGGSIYIINSDGTDLRRLTYDAWEEKVDSFPEISGDGNKIAFCRTYSDVTTHGSGWFIHTIHSDASNERDLSTSVSAGNISLNYDGTKMVYNTYDGFLNHNFVWVWEEGQPDMRISSGISPSISGDGSKIAWLNESGIYVADYDGTNEMRAHENPGSPKMSYDGSKIAFSTPSGVGVINLDGLGLTSITGDIFEKVSDPSISYDGQKIVFSSEGDIYISRQQVAPVASFNYSPTNPKISDTIEFDASNSYDSDGSIMSYIWDFGDGDKANGIKVNHAYSISGTFTVNLTVVDSDDLSDTMAQKITIYSSILKVTVEPQSLILGVGLTATFTASASGGTPPYSYQWYEGTGSMPGQTQNVLSVSKNEDGSYSYFCEVTDSTEQITQSLPAKVVFTHDLASFISPVEYTCELNQKATINVTASGGLPPYEYQWYDGTSALSDERSPQLEIVKDTVGVFTFYCQVKDSNGTTVNSNQVTLDVTSIPPLEALIEVNKEDPIVGEIVVFSAKPSGGKPPYSYQWYEDGTKLLVGENSDKLIVSLNTTRDSLRFCCKVTDSRLQSMVSNQITLTVIPNLSIQTGIPIEVIAAIVIGIMSSIIIILWWHFSKKENIFAGILGPGWQFYLNPTTKEGPGTIFRITPDKKKFIVTKLDVKIRPSDEVPGKYERNATLGVLLRFYGFSKADIKAESLRVQKLNFEIKNAKGEVTFDEDIDPELNKWIQEPTCDLREGHHYFIIRKSIKTNSIIFELTEKQSKMLKEKTEVGKKLKHEVKASSKKNNLFELPKEFDRQYRIMFIAEEIGMKKVNGKIVLSHHPMKKSMKYIEGT